MSENRNKAEQIFEALSAVDEELLIRSEERKSSSHLRSRKTWEIGIGAVAALLILIGGTYTGVRLRGDQQFSDSSMSAPAQGTEEFAVESATEASITEAVEEAQEEVAADVTQKDSLNMVESALVSQDLERYTPADPVGYELYEAWQDGAELCFVWKSGEKEFSLRISEMEENRTAAKIQSEFPVYKAESFTYEELAGCERDGVYHFGLIYEESLFAVFEGAMEAQTIWQMIQDIAGR